MPIRITGMNSGLDTDSMVQELVKASSSKKESLIKDKTKLGWKQEIWKSTNSSIYSFFSTKLSNMRYTGSYNLKKTTVTDPSIASVVAGDSSVNGTQTLAVKSLAKTAYVTGGQIEKKDGKAATRTIADLTGGAITEDQDISFTVKVGGKDKTVSVKGSTSLTGFAKELSKAGLTANFDESSGRMFISAKSSGAANDFEFVSGGDAAVDTMLSALKLTEASGASVVRGQDAAILLNGAEFTSKTNSFSINGLTIVAQSLSAITGQDADGNNIYAETTLNTSTDIDGIYNSIKDFFKSYNEVIKQLDSLYNADSAKDYEPLTDEEKESMSESQIEAWEKKIKDALLRRDPTLANVIDLMKTAMLSSYKIDGATYSLSSFGIETMGYFGSAENEQGCYHIQGDPDDTYSSGDEDKLKKMIASNPEAVSSFFTKLTGDFYDKLNKEMRSVKDYRSVYNVYDDKKMQSDYEELEKKIKDQETKLTAIEDRYYKQFSQMEKALAGVNSQQTYIQQLMGM